MPRTDPTSAARRAVSLKTVAKKAKCSVSAAAAVLNGVDNNTRVSDSTRKRIEKAGEQLGYRRNYLARALRTGRSHVLGVMTGSSDPMELHAGFWGRFLGGVEQAARAKNCDLLRIGAHPGENEFDRGVRMLEERQLDALVVPSLFYGHRLEDIERIRGPVAVAFTGLPVRNHPLVGVELGGAVRDAVRHLAELGHREVLRLGYRMHGEEAEPQRKQAFDAAIAEFGLRSRESILDEVADQHGTPAFIGACAAQFARLLERGEPPTAIVAYNELAAMGVYSALRARGLRVPQDVSVIGYDDFHAELADPPMTVVSLQLDELGREIGALALRLAEEPALGHELAGKPRQVAARLVVRQSTGPRRP